VSDLISRKALISALEITQVGCTQLHEILLFDAVMAIIDNQPTAYDVDKVVKQIEDKTFTADLYEHGWDGQTVHNLLCLGDVIAVMEGGQP
jgi:hypothetical protein